MAWDTWQSHASPCGCLHGTDVARCGHVAGPCEPTWMPGWRLCGMMSNKLATDGPTGIVGPG